MTAAPVLFQFRPPRALPAPPVAPAAPTLGGFVRSLAADPAFAAVDVLSLLRQTGPAGPHPFDRLAARADLPASLLYHRIARYWATTAVDLASLPPDPRLLWPDDHVRWLAEGYLPWQASGGLTVIVTAYPDRFAALLPELQRRFGPVGMAVAARADIETAVLVACGARLAFAAETRVDLGESCRTLHADTLRRGLLPLLGVLVLGALLAPATLLLGLTGVALLAMAASFGLKLAVLLLPRPPPAPAGLAPVIPVRLPVVSVMVALFRESDVAARLAQRLGRLDYPAELLDILLVVEAEDSLTRAALARASLPATMRVVIVPPGAVKTKPRALNHALCHCRGTIIGVYDAEDAPEPDQLRRVVQRFAEAGPDVACLQGVLDFYNPRVNWLSRCFTIEYAAWFRLFLPGIARMGLAIPLGGTTLFFRRHLLEQLGGWDAQNVTEDADLGMRLYRHGYRTELLATVTFEEANCAARPWVKQRSRWIKGYMMTWISHMRDPVRLWRQLGPWRFAGFQILVLGSVLQSLLAPLLWSLWLVALGGPHPLRAAVADTTFTAFYLAMFAVQVLTMAFDLIGLRRSGQPVHPLWVPTLGFYHMLASLAALKALAELMTRPFYWDKTSHGSFGG